ncbi:MAG: ABC transporter permease [Bacteroidota bacterium]
MKFKDKIVPPKFAESLLERLIKDELVEEVLGDLDEKFYQTLKVKTTIRAKLNYWYQVLNYIRPFALKKYRSNSNNTDMFKNYFKVSFRNLRKNKGYSFINLGGLAFGITVTLLISLWVHDELSFNTYHTNHNRIARVIQNVTNNGEIQTWTSTPFPLAEELRTNYSDNFKHIAMAVSWGGHSLTLSDKTLNKVGGYFENDAPEILDLKILEGTKTVKDPASILLSESTALAYFGDNDPINQVMQVDEMPPVKVIGVYQDIPENSSFGGLDFITTWDFLYNNEDWFRTFEEPWRPNFVSLYVELNPNIDIDKASENIKDAKLKNLNEHLAQKKPELFLHPMEDWYLRSNFENGVNVEGRIQYVWMFGIIGIFVLILACINFMNLSTARNEIRAKEVGIRKTIGSAGNQLVLQFFVESFMIVLFSFLVALLLSYVTLPVFNEIANKEITVPWSNVYFWLVSLSFIVITAIIAGSYPALYLSSFKPVQVLKGTFSSGRYSALPRKILVVFQFTISIALIIGTIVVDQQIQYAKNRPVGYSRDNLLSIPITNDAVIEHFDAISKKLKDRRVITSMAKSGSALTALWGSTSGFSWEGKDPNLSIDFGMVHSSYDYGKTIDWNIVEGRDFSREYATDSSAVILNQTAAQFMGLEDPVGQIITWWDRPYTVIGVIEDMVMESPYARQNEVVYFLDEYGGNMTFLKLNPEIGTSVALETVESVFKEINPEQPFEFQFVNDDYNRKFGSEERVGKLAGFFSILAILICCLGIFGLTSFMAERRTKEIGIRKILGASVSKLWELLTKDFVFMVVISGILAAPIAYYLLSQWLSKYEYHTSIEAWVFILSCALTLAITLFTVSYQAIKAATTNPVNSLRDQ